MVNFEFHCFCMNKRLFLSEYKQDNIMDEEQKINDGCLTDLQVSKQLCFTEQFNNAMCSVYISL
jgi:hypothetical protein